MARPRQPRPGEGFSQVGRGASLRGAIAGEGLLLVLGRADGVFALAGDLVVAPGGEIVAERATSANLRVDGRAAGVFEVAGAVQVGAGGALEGAIAARAILVDPSGQFEGTLEIGRD